MSKSKYVTPKGSAMWPWLNVPDTRYDATGKYKCDLMVSKEAASDMMTKAKEIFIEEFGEKSLKTAKWPFQPDEESGGVRFRAKSSKKPVLYDAKGKVIKDELNIGNGSQLKLSGVMSTYNAGGSTGVTMYLNAVQVIDLVEYGGTDFTEEEGYEHTATPSNEGSESGQPSFDF